VGKPIYKKLHPEILSHYQKQQQYVDDVGQHSRDIAELRQDWRSKKPQKEHGLVVTYVQHREPEMFSKALSVFSAAVCL
jgi:hypothetical protein